MFNINLGDSISDIKLCVELNTKNYIPFNMNSNMLTSKLTFNTIVHNIILINKFSI